MIKTKREFIHYFETRIRPNYETRIEEGRTKIGMVKEANRKLVIRSILILFALSLFFHLFGFILAVIVIVRSFAKKNSEYSRLTSEYNKFNVWKEELFNEMLGELMPGFKYANNEALKKEEFDSYSIFASDHYHSEEAIIGQLGGKEIRVSEAEIWKRGYKTTYRIFRGLIAEFEVDIESDFKIIVAKKNYYPGYEQTPVDNPDRETNLEEINITNLYFDNNYRILTNDPIKANKLLQPKNLDKLIKHFEDTNTEVSFAISNNRFIILIKNNHNIFEIYNAGRFEPEIIWDELIGTFDIIRLGKELIEQLKVEQK